MDTHNARQITLFVKHSSEGKIAVLIVYVDDIILTGDNKDELFKLKTLLAKEFETKDLGNLKYFLGMEVTRSRNEISVSQRKYVLELLRETGMLGCKPAETPLDSSTKLGAKEGSTPVEKGRYQRLVGKLIYLSHTRLDIGFAVSVAKDIEVFADADWAGSITDRRSTSGYCTCVGKLSYLANQYSILIILVSELTFLGMAEEEFD
ncbi:uncharacterized protein LOC112093079 [Morus notabilis]|uniref:uncharacterized protein LOC112093079 n=1 Tax=Morus notabilis TaxID=981085 RepID=UPI000CECF7C1|nr:uncharacterized protein LOC112093079 [Morus notabilis]